MSHSVSSFQHRKLNIFGKVVFRRLQSIIRSQAAHLGLIRPQNTTTSTPNIVLNNNIAGVIQKQSTSQSCKFFQLLLFIQRSTVN